MLVLYVNNADARAQEGLEPVNVLVVQELIPAGTPVGEIGAKLQTKALAKTAVAAGTLDSLSGHEAKVTAADLLPGEQLLGARLVEPEDFLPGTVPVPDGLEEVTVLLAPERMLGGRIKAGDSVGLYISIQLDEGLTALPGVPQEAEGFKEFTNQNFQNVLVTAVQQAAPETEDSASTAEDVAMPNGSAFVTLAVNDLSASKVIFGAEFGTIWLSKENDKSEEANPPIITVPEVTK